MRIPNPQNQAYIHDKYLGELVHGVFLPATRGRLLAIVHRLKQTEGIEGLVMPATPGSLSSTPRGFTWTAP